MSYLLSWNRNGIGVLVGRSGRVQPDGQAVGAQPLLDPLGHLGVLLLHVGVGVLLAP